MYGIEITKTLMRTLREEVKVYYDVVDAWVDVMNYEEVDRTAGCETHIYFRTTLIDSWLLTDSTYDDDERMKTFRERMMGAGAYELIGFKMLFFPILENDQYYLIVFNLENVAITVIDHKPDRTPLVGIRDHQDYYNKDTPYKLKHMLVAYLERSEHPSMDQLAAPKIKRCDIHWVTPAHPMDSAVFLMQHMQNFNGINEPFECGFSGHWKRKQKQILALRKNSLHAYISPM
ncbi:putative papain-like cysteine peptidase superfamily [Helianthus debilis subsp. tardiflorus]